MLLNLYGDGLVFQALATGFKEAHIQDRLKFEVVEAEKVGQKFKDAVKKAYNAKFLDDADMVIRFAEQAQQEPEPEPEEKPEEKPEEAPEEKPEETPEGDSEEVSEAETTAQGADFRKKVINTVKRCLYVADADKVELYDLEDFLDGYKVYFLKVSIKDQES